MLAAAFAIVKALARAGLSPADIDVWEVHEAFAAQALGSYASSRPNWTASRCLTIA
jgi:acetyl-CoA acetyltransferase